MGRLLASLIAVGTIGTATTAFAASRPLPDAPVVVEHFERFAREIAAFDAQDTATATGKTLFVGSSSIRLWDVAHSFPSLGAINRGFGGATTSDVLHYYAHIVARHRPTAVVVYVGENDIADGAEPGRVAVDVQALIARIRVDNPNARVVYLSIKPTPVRWELWSRMSAVNAAMAGRAGTASGFDYLDVATMMLTPEGKPDASLFGIDGLHMNAKGYAAWTTMVERYLKAAPNARPIESAVRTTS
jgi:lysophospholipase L1-like esterase